MSNFKRYNNKLMYNAERLAEKSLQQNRINFLWKEAPEKVKATLGPTISTIAGNKKLIKKITCGGRDLSNNTFLISQLWEKKRRMFSNFKQKWGEKPVGWAKTQETKSTDELLENYDILLSNKEVKETKNIFDWLDKYENNNSYERDIDYIDEKGYLDKYVEGDKNLKKSMKNFQIDTIIFNHILEHIVRDLVSDIIDTMDINGETIVLKTNEYDDVKSKTDYIIKVDNGDGTESFAMIDLTTSQNPQVIKKKEEEIKMPMLFDYSSYENKQVRGLRSVWSIDKDFAFKVIDNYLSIIKKGGRVKRGECLKIAEKIDGNEIFKLRGNIETSIKNVLNAA